MEGGYPGTRGERVMTGLVTLHKSQGREASEKRSTRRRSVRSRPRAEMTPAATGENRTNKGSCRRLCHGCQRSMMQKSRKPAKSAAT